MRIKVTFEIGHSSSVKNKASPEGYTHDWELFVRGADGTNITRFVEKVIFNLHNSFPKPCRGRCRVTFREIFEYFYVCITNVANHDGSERRTVMVAIIYGGGANSGSANTKNTVRHERIAIVTTKNH